MKKNIINLGVGIVAGLAAEKIVKSKTVKNLAVSAVATGLKAKDEIDKTVEKARETSSDILADAYEKKEADEAKKREEEQENDIEAVAEQASAK